MKMRIVLGILLGLGIAGGGVHAQNSRTEQEDALKKHHISAREQRKLERKHKYIAKGKEARLRDEKKLRKKSEKRRQQLEKERLRQSRTRRYRDPTYFGHKRKPKKRKPGKQKFCKTCGIVH